MSKGKKYTPEQIIVKLREAEVLTDIWVDYYNTIRPHSSLGGRAPQTLIPVTFCPRLSMVKMNGSAAIDGTVIM